VGIVRTGTAVVALVAVLLAFAPTATATTVHTPADAITVAWGESVLFDWRDDCGAYRCEWRSHLVFTQNPDPNADVWFGGLKPGKISMVYPDYSNQTITFGGPSSSSQSFTPGDWYWRLCSQTVEGEDDKCYYDGSAPRKVTILPPPPPPPAACADGVDNDGDGVIDLDDPGCSSGSDTNEADPAYRLTRDDATHIAGLALRNEFGRYFIGRNRRVDSIACKTRITRSKIKCNIFWIWPRSLKARRWRDYYGTITINRLGLDVHRYSLRLRRGMHPSNRSEILKFGGLL
jgi:hypothetical protein